jgi:hypothetical protein
LNERQPPEVLEVLPVHARSPKPAGANENPSGQAYIGKSIWGLPISSSHVQDARTRFIGEDERLLAIVKGRAKAHATRAGGFFKIFEHETDKGGSILTHYLIVTDRRVILWARGAFKSSTESFDYSDITGVEQQSGMFYGGVVLNVHGNNANFTEMHLKEAVLVADIIKQCKQRANASQQASVVRPDNDPTATRKAGRLA